MKHHASNKPKLILFLGAGFSASIYEKLLTTQEFYQEVIQTSDYAKENPFHYVDQFLGRGDRDAEMFARRIKDIRSSISALAVRDNDQLRLTASDNSYAISGSVEDHLRYFNNFLQHITHKMLEQLDCTNIPPEISNKIKSITKFLIKLTSKFDLNIVTTNYDNLFNHILNSPRYYLGKDHKTIDIQKLINEGDPCSYIPLKGVVGWNYVDSTKLMEHNPLDLNLNQAFMIPFEWSSPPEKHPHGDTHKILYDKFDTCLKESSLFLSIGFSFRDDDINSRIQKHNFDRVIIVTKTQDADQNRQFENKIKSAVFSHRRQKKKDIRFLSDGFNTKTEHLIHSQLNNKM